MQSVKTFHWLVIQDVVYLVLLSFVCGLLCTLMCLPSMFGYIIGGIILGPSGFNVLKVKDTRGSCTIKPI